MRSMRPSPEAPRKHACSGGAGSLPSSCSWRCCRLTLTVSASRSLHRYRFPECNGNRLQSDVAQIIDDVVRILLSLLGFLLRFVGDLCGPRRSLATGTAFWRVFMAAMAGGGSLAIMLALRILRRIAEGPQFATPIRWSNAGFRSRSPVMMGALIADSGSFNAGLMVLVGAAFAGEVVMIPLARRF